MKSWLLTGATGFIGANVARAMLARGDRVRCLVRKSNRCVEGVDVELMHVAMGDSAGLSAAAAGTDGVLHVAGTFDPGPGGDDRMREIHVDAAAALITAARKADVPFLYCSSSVTVGYGPRGSPGDESTPLEPDRVYGTRGPLRAYYETKLAGERLTRAAGGVIVNPDFVLGAWDIKPTSGQLLLAMARHPIPASPRGGKCFIDAQDCALGHLLAIERGAPGQRYLLGNHNLSYREFLSLAAQAVGRRPPTLPIPNLALRVAGTVGRALQRVDAHRFAGLDPVLLLAMQEGRYRSGQRARDDLGLPVTPMETTISTALGWFREHGYL
ncbi:MAG: NAD-dependent epimerase/dehydratase family protein [Myxococcales bacterium]|nr:NAD-dependent epimerase/dehydratase family protein [Myxococcales bacterium]